MMPNNVNFCCAHCLRICNWNSREPVPLDGRIHEYKTIGGMYCNAEECIQAEEKAHGITRDRMPWRVVFETPGTSSARRFYFCDGHCEIHRVRITADGCPPRYYELMEFPELSLTLGDEQPGVIPRGRKRVFELRSYGYPPGFIGPHRDADYHEV